MHGRVGKLTLMALPRERLDLAMGLADTPRAGDLLISILLVFLVPSPMLMLAGAKASAMPKMPVIMMAVRMMLAGHDSSSGLRRGRSEAGVRRGFFKRSIRSLAAGERERGREMAATEGQGWARWRMLC